MDMILFEVFLKIQLRLAIPQQQILQWHLVYYMDVIDNVIVLSDLVESSGIFFKNTGKKDHVHDCALTGRVFYGIVH